MAGPEDITDPLADRTQTMALALPQVGEVFAGRYEILEHLGTGGMSSVYKTRDRLIGEIIALKAIRPGIAEDAKLLEKFKQELLVARRLTHRNVVRIHDIGEHRGLLYITMEFIDGPNLTQLLRERGRFSPEEFLTLARQFCEALTHVHSQGILHRDIKPLNVMLASGGVLKLMDFGIARDLSSDRTVGAPIGTPAYMAPELLMGREPSRASDIYSAGVMFYELLTGKKPLENATLKERITSPAPSIAKELPETPEGIAKVVQQCLAPEPSERFQSVEELLKALEAAGASGARPRKAGDTLAALIAEEPADPLSVLPLFVAIVERLNEIHNANMAHPPLSRAIRILGGGKVDIAAEAAVDGAATAIAGEAKYAAPEMFQEQTGVEVKPGSQEWRQAEDIYVLGFMFYEILLGGRLFRRQFADVLADGSDFAWLNWHGDPKRQAKPLKALLAGFYPPLSDVIEQMVQKERSRRVKSLADVRKMLEEGKGRLDVTQFLEVASEVAPAGPKEKEEERKPKALVVAVVLVVLVVALAAGAWLAWRNRSNLVALAKLVPGLEQLLEKKRSEDQTAAQARKKAEQERLAAEGRKAKPLEYPPVIETSTGEMVLIPEGEFVMGNDHGRRSESFGYQNEAPAHPVKLSAFYIDRLEVTNGRYKEFCDVSRQPYPANPDWDPEYFSKTDYPVMNISWEEARAFAAWAGKRLPSEAEWEKAARGTGALLYPWGNEYVDSAANLRGGEDGSEFAAAAGSFLQDRSFYGVLDLAGNVPEWVENEYGLYEGNPAGLPASERGQRVIRGGGFILPPAMARTTNRASHPAELRANRHAAIGFRCATDPEAALRIRLK